MNFPTAHPVEKNRQHLSVTALIYFEEVQKLRTRQLFSSHSDLFRGSEKVARKTTLFSFHKSVTATRSRQTRRSETHCEARVQYCLRTRWYTAAVNLYASKTRRLEYVSAGNPREARGLSYDRLIKSAAVGQREVIFGMDSGEVNKLK